MNSHLQKKTKEITMTERDFVISSNGETSKGHHYLRILETEPTVRSIRISMLALLANHYFIDGTDYSTPLEKVDTLIAELLTYLVDDGEDFLTATVILNNVTFTITCYVKENAYTIEALTNGISISTVTATRVNVFSTELTFEEGPLDLGVICGKTLPVVTECAPWSLRVGDILTTTKESYVVVKPFYMRDVLSEFIKGKGMETIHKITSDEVSLTKDGVKDFVKKLEVDGYMERREVSEMELDVDCVFKLD